MHLIHCKALYLKYFCVVRAVSLAPVYESCIKCRTYWSRLKMPYLAWPKTKVLSSHQYQSSVSSALSSCSNLPMPFPFRRNDQSSAPSVNYPSAPVHPRGDGRGHGLCLPKRCRLSVQPTPVIGGSFDWERKYNTHRR